MLKKNYTLKNIKRVNKSDNKCNENLYEPGSIAAMRHRCVALLYD